MRTASTFRERKEVRSFNRIRHSNSGRVLNLIHLTETANADTKDGQPSCRLFFNNVLNYAILTKHNLRDNEREFFSQDLKVATKIFVPFDHNRLDVGGRSFFIEEQQFKEHLRALLHVSPRVGKNETKHDIVVLESLSRCPTLDPFIITECLRSEGIRIEPTFFAENFAVMSKASEDVFQIFKPLVQKALGKMVSAEEMARFIDQVWNVTAETIANPFLEALQIPKPEWANVIFAWKSLIYYDLTSRGSGLRLKQVLRVLKETAFKKRPSREMAVRIGDLRREFARQLYLLHDGSSGYIGTTLQKVSDAILNDGSAAALSQSLRSMADNISDVGMNIVLFDQVTSFFLHLYPRPSIGLVDPGEFEAQIANLCDIVHLRGKSAD